MKSWNQLASEASLKKTMAALKKNAITPLVVESGAQAKAKVLELLPAGAEVMNMTSVTLETIGVAAEIMESGRFNSVRKKLNAMDRSTQGLEMQKLGAAPEWAIGSVPAVTEEGTVLIASNTGSQLPAYAYGASHVLWVVGTQKIVKDFQAGWRRIYEHSLPLESERAKKAYGVPGSAVNKILVIHKEVQPNRITLIFVKEVLGF
jgi:hypothetical protein